VLLCWARRQFVGRGNGRKLIYLYGRQDQEVSAANDERS
jgi:hypothetical protein